MTFVATGLEAFEAEDEAATSYKSARPQQNHVRRTLRQQEAQSQEAISQAVDLPRRTREQHLPRTLMVAAVDAASAGGAAARRARACVRTVAYGKRSAQRSGIGSAAS
eukprot:524495-Pleurochrysis_carterae.AAC.5